MSSSLFSFKLESGEQEMNNADIFRQGINEYIHRNNTDYAVLVTGDWGCGKSYYLKNTVAAEYNSCSSEDCCYRVITVSAAGLSSSAQLFHLLFEKIKGNRVLSAINKSSNFFSAQKDSNVSLAGSLVGWVTEKFQFSRIRKEMRQEKLHIVLIIDDIERYKGALDELFAAVQNTFVEQHTHVIYVAFEDDLLENESYRKYKEKYIRYTLHFNILDEELVRHTAHGADNKTGPFSALLDKDENAKLIVSWMKKTDIINLRTFIIAVNCYNHFASVCPLYDNGQSLYLFFTALSHAAFVKTGWDTDEKGAFENFKRKHDLGTDGSLHLPRFYASFNDYDNICFSPLVLSYITNGYADPELIKEYLQTDYGFFSKELVALDHLGSYQQQSESQVQLDISTLVNSIMSRRLPYAELVNAAGALSATADEHPDTSWKEIIISAVRDKAYPGRDRYLADVKIDPDMDTESFAYSISKLVEEEKKEYDCEQERLKLASILEKASSPSAFIISEPEYKGLPFFVRICAHGLESKISALNDRGLYRIIWMNLKEISDESRAEFTSTELDALTKIRSELECLEKKKESDSKLSRFCIQLEKEIDSMLSGASEAEQL